MVNVEVKARCSNLEEVQGALEEADAEFVGEDHQTDTYFRTQKGRLKLREGEIETALIYYDRPDEAGPKRSDVLLYKPQPASDLKAILAQALGVLVVVEKRRKIYFLENVKVHLDQIDALGAFVEIEAQSPHEGKVHEPDQLRTQCETWLERFGLESEDFVAASYSDLMVAQE